VEIGRQDYFFDNFLTDEKVNATAKTNVYPLKTSRLSLDTKVRTDLFPNAGFYQLRAHFVNAEGKRVGVNSDPVTLKLSR
jgi:hypothetical protein